MGKRNEYGLRRGPATALVEASPETQLMNACERWLEHYDNCVRDKFIGDEPGIPEMRRALQRLRSR